MANSPEGIRSLISLLPLEAHCVLEATGSYSVLLTYLLSQAQITMSVRLNALKLEKVKVLTLPDDLGKFL